MTLKKTNSSCGRWVVDYNGVDCLNHPAIISKYFWRKTEAQEFIKLYKAQV